MIGSKIKMANILKTDPDNFVFLEDNEFLSMYGFQQENQIDILNQQIELVNYKMLDIKREIMLSEELIENTRDSILKLEREKDLLDEQRTLYLLILEKKLLYEKLNLLLTRNERCGKNEIKSKRA